MLTHCKEMGQSSGYTKHLIGEVIQISKKIEHISELFHAVVILYLVGQYALGQELRCRWNNLLQMCFGKIPQAS